MQFVRATRSQHHLRPRLRLECQGAGATQLLPLKGRLQRRQIGCGVESDTENMDTNVKRLSEVMALCSHQGKRHCSLLRKSPPDSQTMTLVRVLGIWCWYQYASGCVELRCAQLESHYVPVLTCSYDGSPRQTSPFLHPLKTPARLLVWPEDRYEGLCINNCDRLELNKQSTSEKFR